MLKEMAMPPRKQQTQLEAKETEELKKLAEELLNKPKLDITDLVYESHRRVRDYFDKRENATTRVRKVS